MDKEKQELIKLCNELIDEFPWDERYDEFIELCKRRLEDICGETPNG